MSAARAYSPPVVEHGAPPDEESARGRAYRPYGGVQRAWFCRDPEVLLDGPKDTGKTRGILERGHYLLKKYPGARALLLRKTRTALTQTALVTFEEKVMSEQDRLDLRVDLVGRQYRQEYVYPNGSRAVVGGLDNPAAAQSGEYDLILGFEWLEASLHEHEMMTGLLRNGVIPFQQGVFDTNPGSPTHWLNARANSGLMTRFLCRHADNPSITPDRLARLHRLTGVRHKRLALGLWAAAEGMVYDSWDPAVHVVDRFTPPDGWRRWWVVDFGFTHPFVWQEWVEDGDGRLYLYREIYHTGRTVAEHGRRMLLATAGDPPPAEIICDHDAEDRATLEYVLARGVWACQDEDTGQWVECREGERGARLLRLQRSKTTAAWKSVKPGIEAVKERMVVAGDGRPRLMLMHGALVERDSALDDPESSNEPRPASTAEEPEAYVLDDRRDAPVKENDHGMDGMRYVVAHVDKLSRGRGRTKPGGMGDGARARSGRARLPELANLRGEEW